MHALFFLAEEASENQLTRRSMKSTVGLIDLMKKIEQRYAKNKLMIVAVEIQWKLLVYSFC